MENQRNIIQQKILSFVEQKESKNQTPDMLAIMNNVSRQLSCEPIKVVNGVAALRRELKLAKVRVGMSITYRKVTHIL